MEIEIQKQHASAAFDWFVAAIGPESWRRRRSDAIERLKRKLRIRIPEDWPDGRLPLLIADEEDRFIWDLLLCEAWLSESSDYEPMQGARVIPVMIAIGANLERLTPVDGVKGRVQRLAVDERAHPEHGLFELLVAACYGRNGFSNIRFVPEEPPFKRHDLEAERDSRVLAIECKRLTKSSEYALAERETFWRMWGPLAHGLLKRGLSIGFDITFHLELDSLSSNFLSHAVADKVSLIVARTEIFTGQEATIVAWPHNEVRAMHAIEMQDTNPGRLKKILCGGYERDKYFAFSAFKGSESTLVASVCWQSDSPDAIRKKARHVLKHLAKAVKQLPTNMPCAIHVGLDAIDGNVVEANRYARIRENTEDFDPAGRDLKCIYVHVFAPECPPDMSWAIDETVYHACPSGADFLLKDRQLLIPDSEPLFDRPHWSESS
jgi:hypothetical protein